MISRCLVLPLILSVAVVAGCAAPPAPAQPSAAAGSPLASALGRVSATVTGYVEFVDLRALATGSDAWQQLRGGSIGRLGVYAGQLSERLRIDLAKADWTVTASGNGPTVTLVAGGQDAAAIRSAAQAAGWNGPDVLSRDLSLDEPLTVQAGTLRPSGQDVVVAGSSAPIGIVDGPGPRLDADPAIAGLQQCLGAGVALVGIVRADRQAPVAVGIRPDPADPAGTVNVVCAAHPSASAASRKSGRVAGRRRARLGEAVGARVHRSAGRGPRRRGLRRAADRPRRHRHAAVVPARPDGAALAAGRSGLMPVRPRRARRPH